MTRRLPSKTTDGTEPLPVDDPVVGLLDAIKASFGGMGRGSPIWGNTQWDKGYSAGVLAAVTAGNTYLRQRRG